MTTPRTFEDLPGRLKAFRAEPEPFFKAVLCILEQNRPPTSPDPICSAIVYGALEALADLCHHTPRNLTVFQLVWDKWVYIFAWIVRIAAYAELGSDKSILAARCMFEIVTLDSVLTRSILTCDRARKVMVALWIKADPKSDGPTLLDYTTNVSCPSLSMAVICFTGSESQLHDTLRTLSKRTLIALGRATSRKVRQVVDFHSQGAMSPTAALHYLELLLQVTQRFLESTFHWRAVLEEDQLISAIFDGLDRLTRNEVSVHVWEQVVACARLCLNHLAFFAGPSTINPLTVLAQIAAEGRYLILFRALVHLPPRGRHFSSMLELIQVLGTYTVIPRICALMWGSLRDLNKLRSKVARRSSTAASVSEGFGSLLLWGSVAISEDYSRTVRSRLCDNIECSTTATTRKSRQCSACASAIYCSILCQVVDWKNFHRLECPTMTLAHKRRGLRLWLSFSLKSVYLGFVEETCRAYATRIKEQASRDYPGVSMRSLVTMVDLLVVPIKVEAVTFDEYRGLRAPVPSHLKDRLEAYVNGCQETDSEFSLVETTFSHGLMKVNSIARVKKTSRGVTVVSSAFSFCLPLIRDGDGTSVVLSEVAEICSEY